MANPAGSVQETFQNSMASASAERKITKAEQTTNEVFQAQPKPAQRAISSHQEQKAIELQAKFLSQLEEAKGDQQKLLNLILNVEKKCYYIQGRRNHFYVLPREFYDRLIAELEKVLPGIDENKLFAFATYVTLEYPESALKMESWFKDKKLRDYLIYNSFCYRRTFFIQQNKTEWMVDLVQSMEDQELKGKMVTWITNSIKAYEKDKALTQIASITIQPQNPANAAAAAAAPLNFNHEETLRLKLEQAKGDKNAILALSKEVAKVSHGLSDSFHAALCKQLLLHIN